MEIKFTQPTKKAVHILFEKGSVSTYKEQVDGSYILRIGCGEQESTERTHRTLLRKAIRVARAHELDTLVFDVAESDNTQDNNDDLERGRTFAENTLLANYEFTKYKTKKKGAYTGIHTLYVKNASATFKKGAQNGQIVAHEVNFCRDLANTPGGDMTPTLLAAAAKKAVQGTKATVQILEKKDIAKLKMGLVLGVDQGATEPMKFIVMEYWGAGKTSKQKPVVLVGKGITFDTGGINLKPSEGILGMNHDMAGGASVIAATAAAAKLGIKKNIIALVPAVENAISNTATRPGDIHTAMNGTTVEITNTDAEGRLVLADALTYAERYKPSLVVDVATLTGASLVALGVRASAIMTKDEDLETTLRGLGELSGDYVWPLPLWAEYTPELKSNTADIANLATGAFSRKAGCIHGGVFLSHFTKNFSHWVHIDMAPRMEAVQGDNLATGATGEPTRLLVRLLEQS
ncbi:MAG: leucyl aminopeptidase family protein [Patescibacteria group bacterium UBA2163]